jgi:pimeloyl-ACP methyl ester carboxylesterase
LPGNGLSPPDATGDYTDARALVLINALMDKLEVDTASLIGNSLGGRIAWTYAATHQDRVDKLVLVSPDGFASPGFDYDIPPKVPAIMGAMNYALPKWLLKSALS